MSVILEALKRLVLTAQRRETIMGDVSSLLDAKAELAAAVKAAVVVIAETETWVPIPYTSGEPQPRIKDGIYRGIRINGKGGFEGLLSAAAEPDLDYNPNKKGVAIWRYLDLSTGHLPPSLREELPGWWQWTADHLPILYPYEYGWFMPVCCEKDADVEREAGYHPVFQLIRAYARQHRCSLVRFDADGMVNQELPIYEEVE
jgi:hypothetical protein